MGDFPVQLVVLGHKQAPAGERERFRFGGWLGSGLPVGERNESGIQRRGEQRLLNESVDAGIQGFLLEIRPVVRGNQNDRDVVVQRFADLARDLDSIQIVQLPVQKNRVVALLAQTGKRLVPVRDVVGANADFRQSRLCRLAKLLVVVDKKHRPVWQTKFFIRIGRFFQIHHDVERAALVDFAVDQNLAMHRVHDVFGNRHAKAAAFRARDAQVVVAGERFENDFLKVLAKPDSRIRHDKMDFDVLIGNRRRLLVQTDTNAALFRRELDRVGHKVEQHLIEAQRVAIHVFSDDVRNRDVEILMFRLHLRLHERDEVVDDRLQGHDVVGQRHFSALDFRHVQYVVDQPKQMLAGERDALQVMKHPVLVVDVRRGDRRHPDDRVHRRTDIVGHVGQKLALGLVGFLRLDFQLFRHLDLLPGVNVVAVKQVKQAGQNNERAANVQGQVGSCHVVDDVVDGAKRKFRNQIPL